MKISNRQFKPSITGIVATTLAVCLFGYLAIWQMGRAEERKAHLQLVQKNLQMPVRLIDSLSGVDFVQRYQRFQLTGHFVNDQQVLLDNVVKNGRAGYDVISRFVLSGTDEDVLVNRGWLPAGKNRQELPDITVNEEKISIEVMLDKPRSAPVIGASVIESGNRWNYLDVETYRQTFAKQLPDYIMLLSADNRHGYQREWPVPTDKSGMHIGYAIQWAAFALIALGTFIALSFKKQAVENEQ